MRRTSVQPHQTKAPTTWRPSTPRGTYSSSGWGCVGVATGTLFVAELDPTGSSLVYSTCLGGDSGTTPKAIAIDSSGNAYVTGSTSFKDFPSLNGYQNTQQGHSSAIVAKLDPTGAMVCGTYFGGKKVAAASPTDDADTQAYGIAVDQGGAAYITGVTNAFDLPVPNGFQTSRGTNGCAFVAKLDPSGSTLDYASYLGSGPVPSTDYLTATAVAVDDTGAAYITGSLKATSAYGVPITPGVLQPTRTNFAVGTGFVTHVAPADQRSSIRRTWGDRRRGPRAGSQSTPPVMLTSRSPAAELAFRPLQVRSIPPSARDSRDALPSSSRTRPHSRMGPTLDALTTAIALDADGYAYVTGWARTTTYPLQGSGTTQCAGGIQNNGVVTKLALDGKSLAYSTCILGSPFTVYGIGVDAKRNAYVTGNTGDTTLATTPGVIQPASAGQDDFFIIGVVTDDPDAPDAGDDGGPDGGIDGGGDSSPDGSSADSGKGRPDGSSADSGKGTPDGSNDGSRASDGSSADGSDDGSDDAPGSGESSGGCGVAGLGGGEPMAGGVAATAIAILLRRRRGARARLDRRT